ncbi:MAG: acyl-CoA desaturase [Crocosphaera sp.]|nr:acyl-CoA desaturase [Crocosphaera sp.]
MTSSIVQPSFSVSSASLGKIKRRFILSLSLVSLLGFSTAMYQLFTGKVGILEIGLFLFMSACSAIGITVGFHRYFSHKAFKTNPIIEVILAILGSMAGQGSVTSWVSVHRCHHKYSDQPGDPHSPHLHGKGLKGILLGLWYAHLGWLFNDELPNSLVFAKDMIQDRKMVIINRLYIFWLALGLFIPALLGGLLSGSWHGVFQGFIWGGMARLFWSFHSGYTINSFGHVFGKTFIKSDDNSKNNLLLALLTFGEGWHNNHHGFPHSAKFGLKWWQIDLGYWFIKVLQWIGLAWEVKIPSHEMIEAKKSV